MRDVMAYIGIGRFGRAYEIMLGNDPNPPGSVDRVLPKQMVRLCADTAGRLYGSYTPTTVRYQKGSRPQLEQYLHDAIGGCETPEQMIAGINRLCAALYDRATEDLNETRVGGTEEEPIRRGSWWCTEIARVGCTLCQIAGLPARMVYLLDLTKAYSGHAITEVHRSGTWGAVCPETDVIYRHPDGQPASTWDLMNDPGLVLAHRRPEGTIYTTPEQFTGAAISNYFVREHEDYRYPVSPINDYYRSILTMSLSGWPGGLRWLHGEDA